MTDVSVSNTFTAGTTIVAAEVNQNFSDLVTYLNTTGVDTYQAASVTEASLAADAMAQQRVVAFGSARGAIGGTSQFMILPGGTIAVSGATDASACFWFDPADVDTGSKTVRMYAEVWCVTETDPTDSTLQVSVRRAASFSAGAIASVGGELGFLASVTPTAANTIYQSRTAAESPTTAGLYVVRFQHDINPAQTMTYGYTVYARVT